jgi:hypothetical protein
MTETDEIIGMYELLDALEAAIKSADPEKQRALAKTIEGYHEHFPEDFHWAIGAQAPTLLFNLMMTIDTASEPNTKPRPRPALVTLDS